MTNSLVKSFQTGIQPPEIINSQCCNRKQETDNEVSEWWLVGHDLSP